MNELPLAGNIPDTSLPTILIHLNRSRKSGTLVIKTARIYQKSISCKRRCGLCFVDI